MLRIFSALMLVFTLVCQASEAKDAPPGGNVRLLVLGDSLSAAYGLQQHQGWVSLLQNKLDNSNIDIINGAISGDTSDGALARLPRLLAQHRPTHLYIEIGANDGLQGHPPAKIKANIARMITLAKAEGVAVSLQQMRIPTNYGQRYTQLFADLYGQLAAENDVLLVPFFLAEVALDPALMQRDGIHPNGDAQPIIAAYMHQQLQPWIAQAIR